MTHKALLAFITGCSLVVVPTGSPSLDIRQFMTEEKFAESGLNKLSPQELQVLNKWLGEFYAVVYSSLNPKGGCSSIIESQIEGDFEGWEGETIFKLDNGQIWQQDSYAYSYHYAYRPDVMIFPDGGRCRMKVEGANGTIVVKRLK